MPVKPHAQISPVSVCKEFSSRQVEEQVSRLQVKERPTQQCAQWIGSEFGHRSEHTVGTLRRPCLLTTRRSCVHGAARPTLRIDLNPRAGLGVAPLHPSGLASRSAPSYHCRQKHSPLQGQIDTFMSSEVLKWPKPSLMNLFNIHWQRLASTLLIHCGSTRATTVADHVCPSSTIGAAGS